MSSTSTGGQRPPRADRFRGPSPASTATALAAAVLAALTLLAACDRTAPTPDTRATTTGASSSAGARPHLPAGLGDASGSAATSASASASAAASASASAPPPHEGPWLVITRTAAGVYSEPVFDRKKKIGYARNGAKVPITDDKVEGKRCRQGWRKVVDGGYICANLGTTDLESRAARFTLKQPKVKEILPYRYARNAKHGTPLYKSIPNRDQMLQYEPYLDESKKKKAKAKASSRKKASKDATTKKASKDATTKKASKDGADAGDRDTGKGADDREAAGKKDGDDGTRAAAGKDEGATTAAASAASARPAASTRPASATTTTPAPSASASAEEEAPEEPWWQSDDPKKALENFKLEKLAEGADGILAKRMVKGFYVAIDKTFRWNKRLWYKTTKGLVAPADRMHQTVGFDFQGVELDGKEARLPRAWTYGWRKAFSAYAYDPEKKTMKPKKTFKRFSAIQLTGADMTWHKKRFLQIEGDLWIRAARVRVTDPGDLPADLQEGERWVDVNLSEQTLVLFQGRTPVYATLVSSGKKHRQRAKDHSTPTGEWRVREKHLTTTMDGDGTAAGDLPYSIEDVPYVLYFHRSYALHGAFWHRNFGIRMSHGCVNLAPLDAKRVFFFADPPLLRGFHGAWSSDERPGSRVRVHE